MAPCKWSSTKSWVPTVRSSSPQHQSMDGIILLQLRRARHRRLPRPPPRRLRRRQGEGLCRRREGRGRGERGPV
uniref:Uncharacterized protein n=1 Tax=Leersia perrieri TaxID=77586 RepID=A0A0D9V0R9_9ORYZ